MLKELIKKVENNTDCNLLLWEKFPYNYLHSELVVNLLPEPDDGYHKKPELKVKWEKPIHKLNDPEDYAKTWGKQNKNKKTNNWIETWVDTI